MNSKILVYFIVVTVLIVGAFFYLSNMNKREDDFEDDATPALDSDDSEVQEAPKAKPVATKKSGKSSKNKKAKQAKAKPKPKQKPKPKPKAKPTPKAPEKKEEKKCVDKTVVIVTQKMPAVSEPYDLQKCTKWINEYTWYGKEHNCCADLWNEQIRFKTDHVKTGGVVVEIGGNTGNDAVNGIVNIYKPRKYHIVEPVPSFVTQIKQRFTAFPSVDLHAHQFGIGDVEKKEYVQELGQATAVSRTGTTEIIIQAAKKAVHMFELDKETALLHINCEGCEYSFLEAAIEAGYIKNIAVIQFGTHVLLNGVTYESAKVRYCQINAQLHKTHYLDPDSKPWAWDRWIRREPEEVRETRTIQECN